MAKNNQSGFTLIELILAMTISSALALIAFQGQRELRGQAQFRAAVEKVVSTISDAHTQAVAGVNLTGGGDGLKNCAGAAQVKPSYIFAGTAWHVQDNAGGATVQMEFYAAPIDTNTLARTGADACLFNTQAISVPTLLRLDNPPGGQHRLAYFIRDDLGGLTICSSTNPANILKSFGTGTCKPPAVGNTTQTFILSDADGHSSTINIEPSGLARRIN